MINRIPDKMGEGVVDGLNYGLVQLNIFTDYGRSMVLFSFFCKIPDNSRKLIKDVSNWLHSGEHDCFLQLGGDQVNPLANGFSISQVILSQWSGEADYDSVPILLQGS